MSKLCTLIDYHVNKFGVEPEGLNMLGAMATTFEKAFESRASKYWETAIIIGLQKVNEMATFKAALASVGDFARMMGVCFLNQSSQVMQQIMVYIKESFDRDIKLSIISCMGDLILAVEDFANSFVDQIIDIFDMSFSAVYQILRSTQDEDYVEDLKANLIEMYSCVVFAVNQKKVNYRLYDHFGHLATFIVRTCDKDLHPTVVHFFFISGIPQKLSLLTPRFCCLLLEHQQSWLQR